MKFPNKNCLVSMIVVNYNNANLSGQCIKSLLNQTYRNIEIILVDDNSIDELYKYKKQLMNFFIKLIK